MSTLKTNNVQIGQSGTATNNFTLYQPSTPDGTVRLGVGNSGATTADVITANNSGNVGIGTSSPLSRLEVRTTDGTQARFRTTSGSNQPVLEITASDTAGTVGFSTGGNSTFPALTFSNGGSERARIDSNGNWYMNSGYGSVAVAYGCRAWVNFNGTGTVAIRASGNVSSITDNGTGDYTVNFTNAMPDANYSVSSGCGNDNTDDRIVSPTFFNSAPTTSSFRTRTTNNAGINLDVSRITLQIIR